MNLSKLRKMVNDGDMSVQALRYLLDCKGECEFLDFKEDLHLGSDKGKASLGRDVVAMRNVGGGYIVIGVVDKTWEAVGLKNPINEDTKSLRDSIRKVTGLELSVDIVQHEIFIDGSLKKFALILTRATAKRNKLKAPSICRGSFKQSESWGIRDGDIYFRKGDQTIRISSQELEELLTDLMEKEDHSIIEQEQAEPSPFWIDTGLYRLLPREYDLFIGRTDLQAEVIKAIEGDPRIWIINLHGPGGVGKSALVNWIAYYYFNNKKFDSILQLSAKDTQLTTTGIRRLYPTLFSLENLVDSIILLFNFDFALEEPLEERKNLVIELLNDYSMLLVLDNMETVKDGRIMEFIRSLPHTSKIKVLITSRLRTASWELPIPVKEFNFNEVKEFVTYKSNEMKIGPLPNFETTLIHIHQSSGGLPLAIQWMLGQYALTGNILNVSNQVRDPDSPLLEFSFRNSWSALTEDAQTALAVLSTFDEAPTLRLWATALDCTTEHIEKAISYLIDSTFIFSKVDSKTGQETFHALPITLAFARNELGKMNDLELKARTRYQKHIQEMELVAAETERFSSLFSRFKVERDTEKRAVILARKAEDQASSLNHEDAEKLFKEALEIDPRSVYVLVNYGIFKKNINQIGEAIRLMEEAAQYCHKETGFFIYYNLSKVYDEIRNREQVERCLRKALDYQPENFIARHQLGVVTSRLGKYQEADDIFNDLIRDQLARVSPSDTLIIAYKSKIINWKKSGQPKLAINTLNTAREQVKNFPHLANKFREIEEYVNSL